MARRAWSVGFGLDMTLMACGDSDPIAPPVEDEPFVIQGAWAGTDAAGAVVELDVAGTLASFSGCVALGIAQVSRPADRVKLKVVGSITSSGASISSAPGWTHWSFAGNTSGADALIGSWSGEFTAEPAVVTLRRSSSVSVSC